MTTRRLHYSPFAAGLAFLLAALATSAEPHHADRIVVSDAARTLATTRLGDIYRRLPMVFEPNAGQMPEGIRFLARGPGYRLQLNPEGAVLELDVGSPSLFDGHLRLHFVNASENPQLQGESELPGRSHYLRGGASPLALTDVPQYGRVRYTGVYPGIDVLFYGTQDRLEYDFVLAPGADPGIIRLQFEGAESVRVGPNGELIIATPAGEVRQEPPHVYQMADSEREPIPASYVELGDSQIGFRLMAYDTTRPVVIDPVVNYVKPIVDPSGSLPDTYPTGIAVDPTGNVYVSGYTKSALFPTINAYDRRLGQGDQDMFVFKLDATGSTLLYSTFLGGSRSIDSAYGIAVDGQGSAYITGTVTADDFPVSGSAYQQASASGGGVVAKLSPGGNALVYSTYLQNTVPAAIAVDGAGNAIVTGMASPAFVTTPGVLQSQSRSASGNAFVAKLNATGSAAVFATFLGGTSSDKGNGIAIDSAGNVFVSGWTTSVDFPTVNALQGTWAGEKDAFVAKLDPSGTALAYSTFLGGRLRDLANAIAVDRNGSAYVVGETYSSDFPVRHAVQPVKGHGLAAGYVGNAFLTKLSAEGDLLEYSTFLGGSYCPPGYAVSG